MQAHQAQPGRSQGRGACQTLSLGASECGRLGAGQEHRVLQGRQGFPLNPHVLSVQSAPAHRRAGDGGEARGATRANPPPGCLGLVRTLVSAWLSQPRAQAPPQTSSPIKRHE